MPEEARVAKWFEQHYVRYLASAARRPFAWLALYLALSAGLAWYAGGLGIRGDLEDLFPEDTPAVRLARETRAILGSTSELRILIGSPDRELNRQVAGALAAKLEARTDDIARVEFHRDIAFFEKNALLFLSTKELQELEERVSNAIGKAVRKDLGLDDFEDEEEAPAEKDAEAERLPDIEEIRKKYGLSSFGGYSETPDGTVIAVKAFPKFKPADASRTRALNAWLEGELATLFAAHPNAKLSYAMDGDYSQLTQAVKQITADAVTAAAWSLVFIVVVVVAYFRRFRAVIVVAVILFVANAWMLAFARVSVGYLNLVTSIIVAILNGMGVDYLIHGMSRVDEEHTPATPLADARRIGLLGLARPVINAMLTTAVTFFALMFFDFRGFSQLGLIAGVGLILALAAFYYVFPPLSAAMDRIWPEKVHHHKVVAAGRPVAHPRPVRRALPIGLIAVVLGTAAGFGLVVGDLGFDPDMGKFRVQDEAAQSALKTKYKEAEKRTASPALVVTEDLVETERLHRHLEVHKASFGVLEDFASVYSFIARDQAEKLPIVAEIKRKIDNKYKALEGQAKADADTLRAYLEPAAFGPDDLPPWVRAKFTDTQGRFGRYVLLYASGSKANALVADRIQKAIGTIAVPADGDKPARTFTASATYFISAEAYHVVKREGPLGAVVGLIAVILVVLMDFRHLRELVMILSPLMAGFVIMLGVMVVADLPLDLFNVIVLPQIFGIGIDTGTHLAHRLKEGGPKVRANLIATAKAAGISSLLTMLGFAALIAVQNKGLQSIGWVAVIGISISWLVNVLMFAAFHLLIGARSKPAEMA
jgi:predicted RND superfamily exporter protein